MVGFDDTVFAAYVTPALTTVRRPIEQISKEGALRLLGNIENKQHETEQVLLKNRADRAGIRTTMTCIKKVGDSR